MNNEEVRLECSPKLVKGHSEVNCAHPPLTSISAQLAPVCWVGKIPEKIPSIHVVNLLSMQS